jgi:hypothetical protein
VQKYDDPGYFADIFSNPSNQSQFGCFDLLQSTLRFVIKALAGAHAENLKLAVHGLEILTRNGTGGREVRLEDTSVFYEFHAYFKN